MCLGVPLFLATSSYSILCPLALCTVNQAQNNPNGDSVLTIVTAISVGITQQQATVAANNAANSRQQAQSQRD